MELPEPIATALQPLFSALPIDEAMQQLVVVQGARADMVQTVERVIADSEALQRNPPLQAGLWLYVDELDRSHTISQGIDDATGAFWHGIMHRREGDFSNSHYWFRRTGQHPAMRAIPDYDAHHFIDAVAQQHQSNPAALVERQRQEWAALFTWCCHAE